MTSLINTRPIPSTAEATCGELLAAAASRPKAFIATKVWTSGREAGMAQIEQSFERLQTDRIDLLQVHNLLDRRIQLATLRAEKLDFLQINYALDDRAAAERVLPLAPEIGGTSWAQLLLKFVLSHPAVTCAIPGTRQPDHMQPGGWPGRGAGYGVLAPAAGVAGCLRCRRQRESVKAMIAIEYIAYYARPYGVKGLFCCLFVTTQRPNVAKRGRRA